MAQTGEQGDGQPGRRADWTAPAPTPADVAVLAAMDMEVADLLPLLKSPRKFSSARLVVREGEIDGKVVVVAATGMGVDRARACTDLVLAGHRPRWVISAGFAGALDPALKRNDLVLATEVADLEGRSRPIDVPENIAALVPSVHRARLLTVDRVILASAEKQALHITHSAAAVDMETAGIADLCEERGVRFLSVRVVSDDARSELPPEVAKLATSTGGYRLGAAVRAIWNRPSSLKDFWRLHEHSLEAGDRLARYLALCIRNLPA